MTARRAIVVGGSMAGLFAAHALSRRGWRVDVYERSPTALAGRGAGIVTHPRLDAALAAIGLSLPRDLGVAIPERRLYAGDGLMLRRLDFAQVNTSWERLLEMLRAAWPSERYHLGRGIAGAETRGDRVSVTFADGSVDDADLVVAADGFRSSVREAILPTVQPAYAGYVAWRGLVEAAALSGDARDQLMTCFAFALPAGEQMLGYPVAGDGASAGQRYNFVWYRPAEAIAALPRLLTDVHGTRHAMSVPPPAIAPAVIAEMRDAAAATLPPVFAEVVAKTPMPFLQPIYDLDVETMITGRVALIGDAAFVARPHVGGGVTKAAEDALALASAVAGDDIAAGLARFNEARVAIGRRVVAQGRALGALLDRGREAPPGALDVLRDTASMAFLDDEPSLRTDGPR